MWLALLKEYKKNSGKTTKQISEESGVPLGTLNKLFAGQTKDPKLDTLRAVVHCLGYTLDDLCPAENTKNAPSDLSDEALKVAQDYSKLDQPGKNVVRVVIAEEGKRVTAEAERRRLAPVQPSDTRFIPLYYTPSAAGYTEPAAGQDFDYIEVGPEVPRRADCAIRISGKSMEPHIKDGSTVYVSREPIENGDVGIFYVDGDMLCKQYYRDDQGRVFLLSLNRDYADADRVIHPKDTDTVLTYYGKVLLDFRPRIVV